jgi:hypothetical protein
MCEKKPLTSTRIGTTPADLPDAAAGDLRALAIVGG